MSWDYFALFAIVALLFWGLGAVAAWQIGRASCRERV